MRSSRFPFLVPFVLSALSAVQPLCFADLSEALKADDSRLIVVRDVLSVDQDTTIPKGRHLRIEPGGLIKIATGVTLTIHGGLEAGAYQVFAGDGRVSGDTKIERVLPEWFFDGNYNDEESSRNLDETDSPTRFILRNCDLKTNQPFSKKSAPNQALLDRTFGTAWFFSNGHIPVGSREFVPEPGPSDVTTLKPNNPE